MSKVNLETFAGGALQEKFDIAMEQVLANMLDPNTPWKNKREITVKVTFEQNEDRDDTTVDVSVVSKLAAAKSIGTRMAIGKNIKTGELYAEEYGNQVRGQMSLGDYATDQDEDEAETAENKPEAIEKTVVDFRAVKQA